MNIEKVYLPLACTDNYVSRMVIRWEFNNNINIIIGRGALFVETQPVDVCVGIAGPVQVLFQGVKSQAFSWANT